VLVPLTKATSDIEGTGGGRCAESMVGANGVIHRPTRIGNRRGATFGGGGMFSSEYQRKTIKNEDDVTQTIPLAKSKKIVR